MQRDKKIKLGKSITALLLSIVLLVTSVPFTLAAGPGTYDPIPTFSDDDAREVSASINADGGISVSFPAATVSVLKKAKTISGYMLELVDLGTYTSLHTDTVILRKIVKPTGTAPYSAEITKAEIEQKLSTGLLEDHRYNVSVVAFDSEGWFSEPVNSYVSDVPTFIYDESDYAPVTPNAYAAREILTFESKAKNDAHGTYSDYGTTERTQDDNNTRGKSASFDFMQEGNHLTYGGSANDVGAKKYTYDASGNLTDYSRTKGYAMRIESAPTETVPPKIKIDIPMPAAYADAGLIREFAVLEPFGKANIKPQFADKNLSITKAFVVGKNQNVLRLNLLTAAGEAVTAVYFGDIEAFKAYYAEKYGSAEVEKAFRGQINKLRIMIVYYPEINEYNGVESVQIIIRNYQ